MSDGQFSHNLNMEMAGLLVCPNREVDFHCLSSPPRRRAASSAASPFTTGKQKRHMCVLCSLLT
jgi:hypothetical protein